MLELTKHSNEKPFLFLFFFGAFSWVPSVYKKTNSRLRPSPVVYKRIKPVSPKDNTHNGVVQKQLFSLWEKS